MCHLPECLNMQIEATEEGGIWYSNYATLAYFVLMAF
jgi:hypothetical protein